MAETEIDRHADEELIYESYRALAESTPSPLRGIFDIARGRLIAYYTALGAIPVPLIGC